MGLTRVAGLSNQMEHRQQRHRCWNRYELGGEGGGGVIVLEAGNSSAVKKLNAFGDLIKQRN